MTEDRVVQRSRVVETSAALAVTFGIASVAWLVSVERMNGMNMGVSTRLGTFAFFVILWVSMMAAMMLPAAAQAVVRYVHVRGHVRDVAFFIGSYLGVWTLVGFAVYAIYRPHGTVAAGLVVIVAGVYELTPTKKYFRRCCRESVRSGFEFGVACVGSSIGLMLILVALSAMSITWMVVISVLLFAQKTFPEKAAFDVTLALAIISLGTLIIITPSSIPGLLPMT